MSFRSFLSRSVRASLTVSVGRVPFQSERLSQVTVSSMPSYRLGSALDSWLVMAVPFSLVA